MGYRETCYGIQGRHVMGYRGDMLYTGETCYGIQGTDIMGWYVTWFLFSVGCIESGIRYGNILVAISSLSNPTFLDTIDLWKIPNNI